MRVTTSRYETNLWSTHINNVRLAEPIRRLVCWRAGFSKSRGLSASKRSFLSHYPLPPPLFFGSRTISLADKTENPVPRSFFSPKTNGNACYAGYVTLFSLASCRRERGGKIRRPRPLYNFRAAQETATKITRNNVLNNPSGLSCN